MTKILVVAEHDGENLNPSTAKCVTCASQLDGAAIDVIVLGANVASVAAQAAAIGGLGWDRISGREAGKQRAG